MRDNIECAFARQKHGILEIACEIRIRIHLGIENDYTGIAKQVQLKF